MPSFSTFTLRNILETPGVKAKKLCTSSKMFYQSLYTAVSTSMSNPRHLRRVGCNITFVFYNDNSRFLTHRTEVSLYHVIRTINYFLSRNVGSYT